MTPLATGVRTLSTSTHPRTLLLTFDAFGTLFYPNPTVPEQYATVAHEFGLPRDAVTPQKVKEAFKDVYPAHAKRWPNYGRADVLRGKYGGPKQWWGKSYERVSRSLEFPSGMVDVLLDRFASDEGYALYEDVIPFFTRMRELRSFPTHRFDRIVLGIVSNSDDRVPAVLKALGLRVGDLRADQDLSSMELPGFEHRDGPGSGKSHPSDQPDVDLDLVITSYEAGEGKPNRLIFDVAKRQARLLPSNHMSSQPPAAKRNKDDNWVCIHVGDEYEKDYRAAIDAGWESFLIPRSDSNVPPSAKTINSLMDLIDELELHPKF
ncbi:hypothetical protein N7509_001372 [Penicillium cosmopolitanum]|uniref:Haloacid dehalogenase-like hydrolase n=1 Tax=Penicillium cosmopolitanum TaxID=1131564 RepID=A0A9W9WBY8_9EURO|nr:uncharacterized protein N7509_001372 [Penicillium cosmopolitanum]KAJ5414745.1 hypothetical protein N7509_001372 [Penicillium cosmopolitanum]